MREILTLQIPQYDQKITSNICNSKPVKADIIYLSKYIERKSEKKFEVILDIIKVYEYNKIIIWIFF